MYTLEMHDYSPIFQGQLIEKNKPITLRIWVPGRVEEMPKKKGKNVIYFETDINL